MAAMQCEGRVALVTGSSSGISRSTALTLAREGASVVVNYSKSRKDAEEVVAGIEANGGSAISVQADIQSESGCRELVNSTISAFHKIDILVVSPGAGFTPSPFHELDAAEATLDVAKEVAPAFHLMRLALPDMYQRKWGRVVGMGQHLTKAYQPAYAHNAAKNSRTNLFLLAAEGETWANGVTVNVIAPGPVETGVDSIDTAIEFCEHGAGWVDRPNTSAQDIAEAIAFLSSESGRFITGCVLPFSFV
jgi:3-oxoacyl-[acyl-carrier protein] reductase